jgi:lipoate-protein ligase A
VLSYPDESFREEAKTHVHIHALTLAEALGYEPNWQAVADTLVDGFRQAMGVTFVESALTPAERETASHLAVERYSNVEWRRRNISSPTPD